MKELLINTAASITAARAGFPLGRPVATNDGESYIATRYEPVPHVKGFGWQPGVEVWGHRCLKLERE